MTENILGLMCGIDLPIPECGLTIHQPKIREIAFIGEKEFFQGVQYLCLNKDLLLQKENELPLDNISNFQLFIKIMNDKEALEKKERVQQVCELFFPSYKTIFTPLSLVFMQDQNTVTIDENNFLFLQEIISQICCLKTADKDANFNPGDARAKEIAAKLMRGRQRVAAQKNSDQEKANIYTQYLSILAIGMQSMPLQELIDLTIFQIFDLIERYKLHLNWDLDIRSRLAGGKPDSTPEDWMKNIH